MKGEKVYNGSTHGATRMVWVNSKSLPWEGIVPGLEGVRYAWGDDGQGAYKLAVALLHHVTGDKRLAKKYAAAFVLDFVAKLRGDEWVITEKGIDSRLRSLMIGFLADAVEAEGEKEGASA